MTITTLEIVEDRIRFLEAHLQMMKAFKVFLEIAPSSNLTHFVVGELQMIAPVHQEDDFDD